MQRRRHTRDGTRRRSFGLPYLQTYSPGNTGRDQYDEPRSNDDPATQEAAAESAYNNAAAAAANSNVTAYLAAVKEAALAAALARSGANSTGDDTDMADAASAETWAVLTLGFSTFSCNVAECRTRGGTATLIGHSEFTSASSPPRKFRILTVSGVLFVCNYGNFATCGTGPLSQQAQYSRRYTGALTYNATTGALTDTTLKESDNGNVECGDSPSYSNSGHVTSAVETITSGTALNKTVTQTARVQTSDGSCVSGGILNGPYPEAVSSCTARDDLTDEDTENDAIVRLQASSSWSNWTSANSTSCLSKYESRSNFSFAWQEAQFRATVNIAENVTGVVKVGVYRRAYGSGGAFSQISTEYFSVTGNVAGADEISMDVPNAIGYETYVACLAAGS